MSFDVAKCMIKGVQNIEISKYGDCECEKCYGKCHTLHYNPGDIDTIIVKCVVCGFEMYVKRKHFKKVPE